MLNSVFLTSDQDPLSLQKLLQEDCSRGSDGLLCQDKASPLAVHGALPVEKELAIFFLDIRDFTGLLQAACPAETIQMVKKLLSLFNKVIRAFGGKLVDRSGDNLYAVFGLRTAIRKAASDAVQTSRFLFDLLARVNADFFNLRFGYELEIGIGLHSGRVFVENAADDREFSVMGLPVNIAARLQAETKNANNDLIISNEIYEFLPDQVKSGIGGQQKKIQVAGLKKVQTVWLAGHPYRRHLSDTKLGQMVNYLLAFAG